MTSNPEIDEYGNKYWYNEKGVYHRDGDLPAIEYTNGSKVWYKNGKRHREQDKPAVEYVNGTKIWWKHGKLLSDQQVEALVHKWNAIRNGDTDLLAEELLNDL